MHGYVVVRLPPPVVAAAREVSRLFRLFFSQSNAEKNKYRTRQEGETVLSHPGYLTPSPGWAELFEVRKSQRDSSYHFPPGAEPACMRLFELMRAQALHWLGALSLFLTGDETLLPSSLSSRDTAPATLRAIHYDQVVDLGKQLDAIPRGHPQRTEAERKIMAGFPAHVDSSLLTIAPRGNVSGLSVRDFSHDKYVRIERSMSKEEAVLFVGDALSYLSAHRLPACMHRPDGLEMARQAPATRLSLPFFLYPDEEATLDPSCVTLDDDAARAAAWPARPPLSVTRFRLNVDNVREEWPWKRRKYYDGRVIARDSDHFPGLESEGDMEYAD